MATEHSAQFSASSKVVRMRQSAQLSVPFLTEREFEALDDLVHDGRIFAYVIYVSGFRRRVDWRTGTVGDTPGSVVSLKYLQQLLERHKKAGSHWASKRPSIDQVRGDIAALEKVGLLARLPKLERLAPMRFRLDLAPTGLVCPQEEPQREPQRENQGGTPGGNHSESGVLEGRNPKWEYSEEHLKEPHITLLQEQQGNSFTVEQLNAVDLAMVVSAYHKRLPGLPKVVHWNTPAYRVLVARVWYMPGPEGEVGAHQSATFWDKYFRACAANDFLMGRKTVNPSRGPLKANFKFLVDPERVLKLINGEYV